MHHNILNAEEFAKAAQIECGRLRQAAVDLGLAPASSVGARITGTPSYADPGWQVSVDVYPPEDESRCHSVFGTGKTLGEAFKSAHKVLERVSADMKRGAA